MAGKVKKTNPSRRGQEKMRRALRRFDLITLGVVALLLISCAWCWNAEYHLGVGTPQGFAYWFLLLLAYPGLILCSLINLTVGADMSFISGAEAPVLAVSAFALVAVAWIWVRATMKRRWNPNGLRIAGNFMMIVLAWGVFQLACGAAMAVWRQGGVNRHIHARSQQPPAATR